MYVNIGGDNKDLEAAIDKSKQSLRHFDKSVGGSVKNIGELRKEYRRLAETSLVGKSPQEVADITKRLAAMRDQMGDMQRTINSLSGDPFERIGESVQSASTMLAGMTGAMTLLGGEEEKMQQLMQKTIALMAVAKAAQEATIFLNERAHGIFIKNKTKEIAARMREALTIKSVTAAAVTENAAKTKGVGTTKAITAAQKLWNKAVATNPLMLLVAALAAVATGVAVLASRYRENKRATENYNKAIDGTIIRNKELRESYNNHVRAMGRVRDEIRLIRGEITQFEFDMMELDREFEATMQSIKDSTTEQLGEALKGTKQFFNGMLRAMGFWKTATQRDINETNDIFEQFNIERQMAQEAHEANLAKLKEQALAERRKMELEDQKRLIEDLQIRRLNGIERELATLRLGYERNLKEWDGFEKAKIELTKTYEHERNQIIQSALQDAEKATADSIKKITDTWDDFELAPIDVEIDWGDTDFEAVLIDIEERFRDVTQVINDGINSGLQDLTAGIAEGLGAMAAGEAGMDNVMSNVAGSVANFMDTLGKSLIASGIAGEAFKKLLTNPAAAIVAGGALVGLAAFTRAKLAAGPASIAPMPSMGGGGGSAQASGAFGVRELGQFTVNVTGTLRADGNELLTVIENENKRTSL